jgi:nucleoside triphosphate diphosphatase
MSQSPLRPDVLAQAGPYPVVKGDLDRALALVRYLRAHCPWDRKQTAETLIPYLLEETHETVEAIRAGDANALEGELGDLLLNLAFQVVVAEETGDTNAAKIASRLETKMVQRHPHLFGLGDPEPWEVLKARARTAEGVSQSEGVLSGVPLGLDPLLRVYRLQQKAAGVGFDWDDPLGALEKVREELTEVEAVLRAQGGEGAALPGAAVDAVDAVDRRSGHLPNAALEDELGDLLFSVVNVARLAGVHPLRALDRAGRKFQRRFEGVETLAEQQGLPIPGTPLSELDVLWDAVKAAERADDIDRP